jgi:hypothetical protein
MPSMPAYTTRRAEKRHRQLILLPRGHPLVGGEELGESRLTELRGTHLAESTEHSCKVLLGLESTCNGYIEDACVFLYQQLLGSLHPSSKQIGAEQLPSIDGTFERSMPDSALLPRPSASSSRLHGGSHEQS